MTSESKDGAPRHRTNFETPEISQMAANYSAEIGRDGKWWIGWIQEIPGVNSQGSSKDELLDNLKSALKEALQQNRAEARPENHMK